MVTDASEDDGCRIQKGSQCSRIKSVKVRGNGDEAAEGAMQFSKSLQASSCDNSLDSADGSDSLRCEGFVDCGDGDDYVVVVIQFPTFLLHHH